MTVRFANLDRLLAALLLAVALVSAPNALHAQHGGWDDQPVLDDDKGELPPAGLPAILDPAVARGYGYPYDSLLADLAEWTKSPRVGISTIGNSVWNRPIWQLTITSPANIVEPRLVVAIHARTHPNEVQTSYVVREIIRHLLSDDPAMRRLLEKVSFNIIPMYNPDGVESESGRVNANGVDLEREWDKPRPQVEAAQLRKRYSDLMGSPTPIRVMLNLHSAYLCKRYFVYHVAEATSQTFAENQQRFIEGVRRYFPTGIQPWHFYQSWQNGMPTHFPESWFWTNYGESVMALTYEDMHCTANGAYDTTAYAILRGVADYLGVEVSSVDEGTSRATRTVLRSVAPNPFTDEVTVRYALPTRTHVTVRIVDALGTGVATVVDRAQDPGWHDLRWSGRELPAGLYYVVLQAGSTVNTLPVLKIE